VVRDKKTFVPDGNTDLRVGDHLILVAGSAGRAATERRLRAISRAGRLAAWYGEQGDLVPGPAGPPEAARPHRLQPAATVHEVEPSRARATVDVT
jgi:cell volume regulation protein A